MVAKSAKGSSSPKSKACLRTTRRTRRYMMEELEPRYLLATDPLYFLPETLSAVGSGTTHENGRLENDILEAIGRDMGPASTLSAGLSNRMVPNVSAGQLNETIVNALLAGGSDLLSGLAAASSPAGTGWISPFQTGSGTHVSSASNRFSQGRLVSTGQPFDFAIVGNGFFVVSDGHNDFYTRNGSFALDAHGELVTSGGLKVKRLEAVGEPSPTNPGFQVPGDSHIRVPIGTIVKGRASEQIQVSGNLNAQLTPALAEEQASAMVFTAARIPADGKTLLTQLDSLRVPFAAGDEITLRGIDHSGATVSRTIAITGTTTLQDLAESISAALPTSSASIENGRIVVVANQTGPSYLHLELGVSRGVGEFLSGKFLQTRMGKDADVVGSVITVYDRLGGEHEIRLVFEKQADDRWSLAASIDPSEGTFIDNTVEDILFNDFGGLQSTTEPSITLQLDDIATPQVIRLDFGENRLHGLVHLRADFLALRSTADGSPPGFLSLAVVDGVGRLMGIATNGETFPIAQLAMASFIGTERLIPIGDDLYLPGPHSPQPEIGRAGIAGRGTIHGGHLEAPNVDVASAWMQLLNAAFAARAPAFAVSEVFEGLVSVLDRLENVLKTFEQSQSATLLRRDILMDRQGDANLDQRVDFADFSRLAASFGKEGTWMNGDFDGNGRVTFGDFLLLASNFGCGDVGSSEPKVNGRADPAALVIADQLRAQIAGLEQALENSEIAVAVVQTAQGALTEINQLLVRIRSRAIDSANSGVNDANALAANQAEIDNALDTINRIANHTQFGTKPLLDGSAGIQGVASHPAQVTFLNATEDTQEGTYLIDVTTAGARAVVTAPNTQSGHLTTDEILNINGVNIELTEGLTQTQVINRINEFTLQTGVVADINPAGTETRLFTEVFGSRATLDVISNINPALAGNSTEFLNTSIPTATGTDVNVGIGANTFTGSGNVVTADSGAAKGLSLAIAEDPTDVALTAVSGLQGTVTVSDSSLVFQIGPHQNQSAAIAVGRAHSSALGIGVAGNQFNNLSEIKIDNVKKANDALGIVDAAIGGITNLRGQLAAFQTNTLESTANNLRTTLENIIHAESVIRDTDFAEEGC